MIKKIGIALALFTFLWYFHGYILQPEKSKTQGKSMHVGLCIMATGKYITFVKDLLTSADTYFLPNHQVTYFVFTDSPFEHKNTLTLYQQQMGWPYDSMLRFHTYYKHREAFKDMDYMFALDADMLFVEYVGDEIQSKCVATILSGFQFEPNPYEPNPHSTAYVPADEGKHYFAGAFYGGETETFLHLIKTCADNVDIDLARGYIAGANDESHINRYFASYHPTVILSPSYCHFDHIDSPYPKKIVAFQKGGIRPTVHATLNPFGYFKKMLQEEIRA